MNISDRLDDRNRFTSALRTAFLTAKPEKFTQLEMAENFKYGLLLAELDINNNIREGNCPKKGQCPKLKPVIEENLSSIKFELETAKSYENGDPSYAAKASGLIVRIDEYFQRYR